MTAKMSRKNLTLPLELVENTIDFLCSDPKTLRAACLVSKAWVPVCRTHLFRRIVLHWCDDGIRRSDFLHVLLTKSPTIVNYIRELSIHEGLVSSSRSQITFCFAKNPVIPKLLYLLPRLRVFEFRASALTHWSELSAELNRAILYISGCPVLEELILGSWNFTSRPNALEAVLAATAQNIKSLALVDIIPSDVPGEHPGIDSGINTFGISPGGQWLALKSLTINDSAAGLVLFCANWLRGRPNAIKSLYLSCSSGGPSISALLGALGESLRHLTLDIRSLHGGGHVDLRRNSRLQSLHIKASDHPPMSSQNGVSIPWIVGVLSTMSSYECLEQVSIGFGVDSDRLRRLSQSDSGHWRHLDQLLSPRIYNRLRAVQIGIKFHCHNGSEYIKEAHRNMYGLAAAGILDIYTETERFCCIDYY